MAKTTTKAATIYTRVSTLEQVSNLSLTTQLEACRHYCETHGLTVDAEFTDRGESAKTTNRRSSWRCWSTARRTRAGSTLSWSTTFLDFRGIRMIILESKRSCTSAALPCGASQSR